MIALSLCVHMAHTMDKKDQVYSVSDDWCKLQDDKLKEVLNEVDQLYASQGTFDRFDLSLLNEQSYLNQTTRWLSSWIWKQRPLNSKRIAWKVSGAMNYVHNDANVASDHLQLRVLPLLIALGDIREVENIEFLVADCKADPLLKDAFGDDAFAYAKRLESIDAALSTRMVAALERYKE